MAQAPESSRLPYGGYAAMGLWGGTVVELVIAIESFLDHRRAANRAPGTLRLYRRQLLHWQSWLSAESRPQVVADLTIDELRDFAESLPGSLSENTRASYHRTLRAFWSFLGTEELISADQQRFFSRIQAPHVPDDPRPSIGEDTIKRLMAACGDGSDEASARNRAIVSLLSETGMRISELCDLTDLVTDLRKRRARVLRAKGGKHRMVFWQPSAAAHLARYLLLRRGKTGGERPLFRGCSIRNNGAAITPDLVRSALKRIAVDARNTLPKGAPLHAIRHGFAHAAIDNGAQLTDLADLLGHADLSTTRIYLRNDDDRLEAAYHRIFSRYPRSRFGRDSDESHG
jgi:site-specific recombinase XerD